MQEIAFEKVAALAPDLILAVMSGVTKEDYAKLSQIAPTVAQPVDAEDWAVPYRRHTEHIGEALGKPDLARTLVDELDAAFAGPGPRTRSWPGAPRSARRSSAGSTPSWAPRRRAPSSSPTSA